MRMTEQPELSKISVNLEKSEIQMKRNNFLSSSREEGIENVTGRKP